MARISDLDVTTLFEVAEIEPVKCDLCDKEKATVMWAGAKKIWLCSKCVKRLSVRLLIDSLYVDHLHPQAEVPNEQRNKLISELEDMLEPELKKLSAKIAIPE